MVYGNVQRTALNSDVTALSAEYNRIIYVTKLDWLNVLSGGQVTIQVGYGTIISQTIALMLPVLPYRFLKLDSSMHS